MIAKVVLVHPRFDDNKESANAVALLRVKRTPAGGLWTELVVNVQLGAVSVTNPLAGTTVLPEIDRVVDDGGAAPVVARLQGSTEVSAGQRVLSDAELLALSQALRVVAAAWPAGESDGVAKARWPEGAVLDLEIKRMDAGWPQRYDGKVRPGRLLLKQLRPLTRRMRVPAAALAGFVAPPDVLAAATAVDALRCEAPGLLLDLRRLRLDANDALHGLPADAPAGTAAPARWLGARVYSPTGAIDLAGDSTVSCDHLALAAAPPVVVVAPAAAAVGVRVDIGGYRVDVAASGAWAVTRLDRGGATPVGSGNAAACAWSAAAISAEDWLRTLFVP